MVWWKGWWRSVVTVSERPANFAGKWPRSRRWWDILQGWTSAGGHFHPVALSYTWLVIRRCESETTRHPSIRDETLTRWNQRRVLSVIPRVKLALLFVKRRRMLAVTPNVVGVGLVGGGPWQTHQTLNISICFPPKTSALHWTQPKV